MQAPAALFSGIVGRYAIHEEIAAGGMATVHLGRRLGPVSFSRTVAIKRLHAHLAREPEFVAMFLDEARLAARVRHPNVVPTLDVVTAHGQPFLVMEYVQGESLARLLGSLRSRGERISVPIACSVLVGMLQGLHAAHEASNDIGESLGIVHRDVSPQNVLVGLDGVTRVLDFGIAKAAGRLQTTREGQLKGKLGYTAPKLIRGGAVTRAADIYSAGVVLWETLTGERLFAGDNDANVLERVLFAEVAAPSRRATDLTPDLDPIVLRALDREPARRFATAREMARAIEALVPIAHAPEVGEWVETLASDALADRARKMARIESGPSTHTEMPPQDALGLLRHEDSGDIPASAPRNDPSIPRAVAPIETRSRRPLVMAFAAAAIGATAMTLWVGLRSPGRATTRASGAVTTEPAAPSTRAISSASIAPSPPTATPPTISADDLPMASSTPRRANPASSTIIPPSPRARTATASSGPYKPAPGHETSAPQPAGGPPPIATAKSACDPPWIVDSRGIKQYKLQCL
jgi:eukaryotic-like serine/threonine-protein kinase